MAITFYCHCGQKLQVPDEMGGRAGKCPTCGSSLSVPAAGTDAGSAPPPAASPPSPPPAPYPAAAAAPPPPPQQAAAGGQTAMKSCPACGGQILAKARKCKHCGEFLSHTLRQQRASQAGAPAYRGGGGTEGMAVASLVLGILSLPTCICLGSSLLFGGLALVFGIMGNNNIKAHGKEGHGMAIAGIVMGSIGVLLGVCYWILFAIGSMQEPTYNNQPSGYQNDYNWD